MTAAELREWVSATVDAAPPLTAYQFDALAGLIRGAEATRVGQIGRAA